MDQNSTATKNKIPVVRLGIMCNRGYIQDWQAACIKEIQSLEFVSIDVIIVNPPMESTARKSTLTKLFSKQRFFRLFMKIVKARSYASTEVMDLLPDVDQIICEPEKKGHYSDYFKEEDVERIRALDLHALVRFGYRILRGNILNCTPYGIWSSSQ